MYLYIMGRAHCGSTILGIVLGGGGTIESVGVAGPHWVVRGEC